jgi:hypothetical protein
MHRRQQALATNVKEKTGSMIKRLRRLLGSDEPLSQKPTSAPKLDGPITSEAAAPASHSPGIRRVRPPALPDSVAQARQYLAKVEEKLDKLAEDFNAGTINRDQFQSLYVHYQRETRTIEGLIESASDPESWKGAVTEGQSLYIRRQHAARAEGYAIYGNESGMPIGTLGRFELDPALLVPMLSSYRSAAQEIFGAGMRSTEIEDGRWLCFVPGEFTTMLAVFSNDPASKQLEFLEDLHRLFERANRDKLANPPVEARSLLFPHEYYLGQWRR